MGRYDSRFMDALSNIRNIILCFAIALLFTFITTSNSISQEDNDEDKEEVMTYRVDFFIPPTIRNHYSYNEKTEVLRTYSDSSTFSYSRDITYFFDVKEPSVPKDGFTTLEISLDSVHYKFTKGDFEYFYNSQSIEPGNFKIYDYLSNIVPMGQFFTMTYSPYGNISNIEGEELEFFLQNSIIDKKDAFEPIDYFLWKDGLSDNRLIHISDFKKVHYPNYRLAEDSTFISPIEFQLNHINIKDTVKMTFEDISAGYMTFGGSLSDVEFDNDQIHVEGIDNYLVNIKDVNAKGTIETILSPRGTPEETTLIVEMLINAEVKVEKFSEKVNSTMKWELLGQWEY